MKTNKKGTWIINYESIPKFHLSLGVSLMIASFILFLVNIDTSFNKIEKIEDQMLLASIQQSNYTVQFLNETVTTKLNAIINTSQALIIFTYVLLGAGFSFFLFGYFSWKKEESEKHN